MFFLPDNVLGLIFFSANVPVCPSDVIFLLGEGVAARIISFELPELELPVPLVFAWRAIETLVESTLDFL